MDEYLLEASDNTLQRELEKRIAASVGAAIPDYDLQPGQYVQLECEECGDELDEFRLKKGRTRCVPCQSLLERM